MGTRDKLYRSIWEEDRKECDVPLSHISDEIKETPLREVDELFGAADVLSIRNAGRHRRILLALSAAGTLLTLFSSFFMMKQTCHRYTPVDDPAGCAVDT